MNRGGQKPSPIHRAIRLATSQAVPAVEALVAGAVADGDVAADVAERGVAHHPAEHLVRGAGLVARHRRRR